MTFCNLVKEREKEEGLRTERGKREEGEGEGKERKRKKEIVRERDGKEGEIGEKVIYFSKNTLSLTNNISYMLLG